MVNPTGYTALDFIGFTDKGAYAVNVNYVKNDLVHYGGNIWRVLIDDTIGITPAEGPNYTVFVGEPINLVERIIAPLEDNPATVAYQTGRQIIYNDHLYEVIQNIGVGDILIAYEDDPTNANIKLASPVETQVLALNASKVNKSDVVNNVTTTTAGKVLDARQGKALQDGINTKVNKSDIANNVTTTTAGKVLDARQGKALQDGKTDTSVIAPVESGTTASRAYVKGEHFIRDGAFCTAKTAIAQGETFTLNTNYTAGNVGNEVKSIYDELRPNSYISNTLTAASGVSIQFGGYVRIGKLIIVNLRVQVTSALPAQTKIVSGFPKSIITTNYIAVSCNNNSTGYFMSYYGDIENQSAINAPGTYIFTTVYIAN